MSEASESKHTPGPWEWIPNRIISHVEGQAVEVCAIKQYDLLDDTEARRIEADGRLITEAPALLATCQSVHDGLFTMKLLLGHLSPSLKEGLQALLEKLSAEIAKARGEAPRSLP